ncbi:Pre-mRNA-processing factor [Sphaerulina musiva]
MATVADELLNDFGDSGDENDEHVVEHEFHLGDTQDEHAGGSQNGDMDLDGDEEAVGDDGGGSDGNVPGHLKMDDDETAEETKARVEKLELQSVTDVRSVAGLMKQLDPLLKDIEHYKSLPPGQETRNIGNIEDNPEYKLLTQSNTLSTQIDGEIILVHKFIRDHYSVCFPELETLVQNPLDYAKAVAIIGNGPMEDIKAISEKTDNLVGQSLKQVLDSPSLMVVTLEATNTAGTPLPDNELATVRRACQMVLRLDSAKRTLTDYVQSRMSMFAPNLTALIGSSTAAQLINYTGGITGLAKTPSCNIAPLGNKKSARGVGLATNVGIRNQGILFNNDIIRQIPQDLKVQAMRILSAKIVLVARTDSIHASPSGEYGLQMAEEVERRVNKLSEAPPNSGIRALPAPDDKPSRKRGGRRVRKMKEATAMTDLRKAQNRMAFGKEEAEVGFGDSSKGLGMIGAQDDGRVRATQIDQRTRAKLSKKNQGWGDATPANSSGTTTSLRGFQGGIASQGALKAQGLRAAGVGSGLKTNVGGSGGTATNVAFTPVQGMELIDPRKREEANRKRKADEDRWFKNGTFTQVGGGSMAPPPVPKIDSSGFKVPALPVKKAKTGG